MSTGLAAYILALKGLEEYYTLQLQYYLQALRRFYGICSAGGPVLLQLCC